MKVPVLWRLLFLRVTLIYRFHSQAVLQYTAYNVGAWERILIWRMEGFGIALSRLLISTARGAASLGLRFDGPTRLALASVQSSVLCLFAVFEIYPLIIDCQEHGKH